MAEETEQQQARISIRLSPQARAAVEEIMELAGLSTIQEAIKRAISDELFLLRERKAEWQVVLKRDNEYREIVWPSK